MWEEIFILNKDNLDKYYKIFEENYQKLQSNFSGDSNNHQKLILQRSRIVTAFLQIEDVIKYQDFAGSGFKDFTAVPNSP